MHPSSHAYTWCPTLGTVLSFAIAASLVVGAPANARSKTRDTSADTAALAADEARLEQIGYRLAAANADRCHNGERLIGMALHDASSYAAAFRPAAMTAYGFTTGFGVRRTTKGSDAARAGLAAGDEIVGLNGQSVAEFGLQLISNQASPRRTEAFVDALRQALQSGGADLVVQRRVTDQGTRTVHLKGDPGCGGQIVIPRSNPLNAWSDGKYVAVTRKMMRFAQSDDELAFVVAHEMAHNLLGHNAKRGPSPLLAELGLGARKIKAAEIDADATAVELLANAGYDLAGPRRLLAMSGKKRWMDLSVSHPGARRRIAAIDAVVAQLSKAHRANSMLAQAELPLVLTGWQAQRRARPVEGAVLPAQPSIERMTFAPYRTGPNLGLVGSLALEFPLSVQIQRDSQKQWDFAAVSPAGSSEIYPVAEIRRVALARRATVLRFR